MGWSILNMGNRSKLILALIALMILNHCTVPTPCPLRINAGADDPDCEDPVKPVAMQLIPTDSATLLKMLSIMRLPSDDLTKYAYADTSHRIVTLGFALLGIDTLPEDIGNLKTVTNLVLNDNNLRSIPKSIGNLKDLTGLRFDNNNLMDIPVEIVGLSKITFLSFIGNPLCNVDQVKINWLVQTSGEQYMKGSKCP